MYLMLYICVNVGFSAQVYNLGGTGAEPGFKKGGAWGRGVGGLPPSFFVYLSQFSVH